MTQLTQVTVVKVVYHLVGKIGWAKVAGNGTRQNSERKFPWDVRVPLPRKFVQGRKLAERPGLVAKSKWKFRLGF